MMDVQIFSPHNFIWMWLVAFASAFLIWSAIWRQRAMRKFATANLISVAIPSISKLRRSLAAVLSIIGLTLLVLALVDIRWGQKEQEIPQRGIEVMFLLDVSRSMLAEDVAPNRLSRAKQGIKDMISRMQGDRVGLVLFAGEVRQYIPLTNHYDDFRQSLDEVGPYNLSRGGSNLAQAIDLASDSFLEKTNDHKAIVLITDGEDQDSDPVTAAEEIFRERGVKIFTIGLGDEVIGAKIPLPDGNRGAAYIEYQGEPVLSKLNASVLENIAQASGGVYIPAGTKRVDMGSVYDKFIGSIPQKDFSAARVNTYVARYQYFIAAAFVAFALEFLLRHPVGSTSVAKKPLAVPSNPTVFN